MLHHSQSALYPKNYRISLFFLYTLNTHFLYIVSYLLVFHINTDFHNYMY